MTTMTAQRTLKDLLLARRKELNLPKTTASDMLGVNRITYDMWERGPWVPDASRARDLADFLDIDIAEVLTLIHREGGQLTQDQVIVIKERKKEKGEKGRGKK